MWNLRQLNAFRINKEVISFRWRLEKSLWSISLCFRTLAYLGELRLCWKNKLSPFSPSRGLDVSFHIFISFYLQILTLRKSLRLWAVSVPQSSVLFPEGWVTICIRLRQRQTSCGVKVQLCLLRHIRPCRCPRRRLLQTLDGFKLLVDPKGQTSSSRSRAHAWQNVILAVNSSSLDSTALKNDFPLGSNRLILLTHMTCQCVAWSGSISVHHFGVFEFIWVKITVKEFRYSEGKVFISPFLCPCQTASNSNSELKYFSLYANSVPSGLDGPYSQVKYWLNLHREALS